MANPLVDPSNITAEHALEIAANAPAVNQVKTNPLINGDRVCGVLMFHYEQKDFDPVSTDIRYSQIVPKGAPEPYVRKLQLTADWTPLDLGWIPNPGTLIVWNKSAENIWMSLGDPNVYLIVQPARFFMTGLCPTSKVLMRAETASAFGNTYLYGG